MVIQFSKACLVLVILSALVCKVDSRIRDKIVVDKEALHVMFVNPEASEAAKSEDEMLYQSAVENLYDWNWNWLNNLLKNVKIVIPDQHFVEYMIDISLTGMECEGFQIGNIDITNQAGHILMIEVEGVKATCKGHFRVVPEVLPIPSSGDFTGSVSNSGLQGGILLTYNDQNIPVASSLSTCVVDVTIDVSFSGSVAAWILNILKGVISDLISKALKTEVCALISPLVATNMTQAIGTLDSMLQPFLVTPTPSPTPSLPANTLNWTTFPPAVALHDLLSSVSVSQINTFLDAITQGTGTAVLPITNHFFLPTFVANFTFDLRDIGLSRIDTLQSLDVLDPIGGPVLNNYIGFDGLGLVLDTWMVLDSKVSPGQYVANNISFAILLDDPLFTVADALAIRGDYADVLANVKLDQLVNPNCSLAPLVYSTNFTHLNLSFLGDLYMQIEGYDPDFDEIMSQLFAVFYSLLDKSFPVLLSNGLDTVVKDMVNAASTEYFTTASCPAATVPSSPFVDLRLMAPLRTLNKLVDQDFTNPININSIISLFTNNSGNWEHDGALFSGVVLNDTAGTLHLAVWDAELLHLDSFTNITLLTPRIQDPYVLDTNISFAGGAGLSIKLSVGVTYTTRSTGEVTQNAYAFTFALHDIEFTNTIKLFLNSTVYYDLSFADLFNPAKLAGLVVELDLESLDMTGNYTLDVQPATPPSEDCPTSQVPFLSLLESFQTNVPTSIDYHASAGPLSSDTLPMPFVLAYTMFNTLLTNAYGPFPSFPSASPSSSPSPSLASSVSSLPSAVVSVVADAADQDSSPMPTNVVVPIVSSLGSVVAIAGVILLFRSRRTPQRPKSIRVALRESAATALISSQ